MPGRMRGNISPFPPDFFPGELPHHADGRPLPWENGHVPGDNIQVVRQALDALGRRDLPGLLEHVDADIELHPLLSVWPRTYSGRDGIEEWWRDVGELWEDFTLEPEAFRDFGDGNLLVRVRWRGRAKGATAELDGPAAAVVRFRTDKVTSVEIHLDEAQALQAIVG
jgi:ketosteroid isomerase-like protein